MFRECIAGDATNKECPYIFTTENEIIFFHFFFLSFPSQCDSVHWSIYGKTMYRSYRSPFIFPQSTRSSREFWEFRRRHRWNAEWTQTSSDCCVSLSVHPPQFCLFYYFASMLRCHFNSFEVTAYYTDDEATGFVLVMITLIVYLFVVIVVGGGERDEKKQNKFTEPSIIITI